MRNDREIFVDEDGLRLEQDRWYHVTAQFVPPVCELFVDGEQILKYEDEAWIDGLNEVALYSWPRSTWRSRASNRLVATEHDAEIHPVTFDLIPRHIA